MPPSDTSRAGTSRPGNSRAGMSPASPARDPAAHAGGQAGPGGQAWPQAADTDRLAALLERARSGHDTASLDAIVAELTPLLWQVARAQGLDRDTAEDVVQTTWLSLLSHLETIRSAGALTGWLVTVTKREAWRVRRAGRGERQMEDWAEASLPDPDPLPDEQLVADDRRRSLWRAVRQLPQRCQELLRIVAYVRRPDYAELSAILGMPQGSIGPTRGRCLAKLRQLLTSDPTWSPR